MWEEENQSGAAPEADSMPGLGSVGVRSFDTPPEMGSEPEIEGSEEETAGESPISGAENATAPEGEV